MSSGLTIAQIQAQIDATNAAILTITQNMSAAVGRNGRHNTLLQLRDLREQLNYWTWQMAEAQGQTGPQPVEFTNPKGAGIAGYDPERNYLGAI